MARAKKVPVKPLNEINGTTVYPLIRDGAKIGWWAWDEHHQEIKLEEDNGHWRGISHLYVTEEFHTAGDALQAIRSMGVKF